MMVLKAIASVGLMLIGLISVGLKEASLVALIAIGHKAAALLGFMSTGYRGDGAF